MTFPRKSGHVVKFEEGAFHTVLGSYTPMPNGASGDYRTLARIQKYSVSPPALSGNALHGPALF